MANEGIHNAGSFGTRGIVTAAGGNYIDRYAHIDISINVYNFKDKYINVRIHIKQV